MRLIVVIALSQAGHLLGFKITQAKFPRILAHAIIWFSRRISPLVLGALLVVIVTSFASYDFLW